MNAPAQATPNVSVEVRDLRKSFHGEEVLKGINLQIAPGQIFVIMGPSGSGKSVLLKHIIGLLRPDSGEILIQGESIASPGIRDKYRMAMVFQSAALLASLTVAENVGIYLSEQPVVSARRKSPASSRPNSKSSASKGRKTACPASFPGACKSAWPLRARW